MYKDVFKNIKGHSRKEVYEDQFKSVTNENYKDFLIDIYLKKDKSKSYIAKLLGTTQGKIDGHLNTYGIKKERIIDSTNKMYKTPSMVEKETGKRFLEVYNELSEQGLSLTEITMKLQLKSISSVSATIHHQKQLEEKKLHPVNDKLIIQGLAGKKYLTVEKEFKKQLGIEYKDFLEQKYIKEGYTLNEISELIGIKKNAISSAVIRYDLHKSQSQIRKEVIDKGIIDLDEMHRKGRKTRNKSKSSNKQDLLITLLKYKLELIVQQNNNIEIVVGYNEYCILGSLEVDIPIIIFKNDKVYKIAIEYDGDVWHNERNTDSEKEKELKQKNWYLIRIEETSKDSANLEKVEEKANYIINKITKYVNQ